MRQLIDDIFSFHFMNQTVYEYLVDDIKKEQLVIPFISDDLSKFAFGSREDFVANVLKKTYRLGESSYSEGYPKESYLSTLDWLIKKCKRGFIDTCIAKYYADEKIDYDLIENKPIGLVPHVGNGSCISASIDRVINYSYEKSNIRHSVVTPYNQRKLNDCVRNNKSDNILLKLYGDYQSNSKELILTQKEYDTHYSEGTDFYKTIAAWVNRYSLLYIGIDVLKDKYLFSLMSKFKSEGIYHYAIVGCDDDPEDIERLCSDMEEIGVLPIIYDASKPVSLEMILHKLLVDTDNAVFSGKELSYKYSEQDIIGRSKELEYLQLFLNDTEDNQAYEDIDVKWTYICGKGIVGKSKLIYDFARLYAGDWDWYILKVEDIDEFVKKQAILQSERKRERDVLLIFDLFDWYAGDIDEIFNIPNVLKAYTSRWRLVFIFDTLKGTALYKRLVRPINKDEQWIRIGKSLYGTPIMLAGLTQSQILELCRGYVFYRRKQLNLDEEKLEELFIKSEEELTEYIRVLYEAKEMYILKMSQLKAFNLIKRKLGVEYLEDSDIPIAVFQQTLPLHNKSNSFSHFDIQKFQDFKSERENELSKMYEKYGNPTIENKQYETEEISELLNKTVSEDEEIFKS